MANAGAKKAPLAMMEEMQIDGPSHDDTVNSTVLQLSEKERQILELYDRFEEIMMEISLLQAQDTQSALLQEQSQIASDKELQEAQDVLLEAKARHALRNSIVESILIANPILRAVHAGLNATPIERDIRPLIQERDKLSVSLTETAAKVLSVTENLTRVEAQHIIVARKNADLASKMIALAEEADSRKKEDIQDPSVRTQLDELDESLKVSRQRWRIMKGTASAVVVGSGIDWVRDAALRDLVLDTEGD